MEVKGVSNNNYSVFQDQQRNQPVSKENENVEKSSVHEKESDKLEISSEARIMQSKTKNLSEIQKKIKENFYNSDEVINYTANAILQEINKSI